MTIEPVLQVHRWRAFAVLAVAFFMTIADLTIVNVALPTIGRKLHVSESDLQWVVTAYGITFGGFLLLGGRAADLLGRRRILMVGLAVFTAASLAAGMATSSGFLIAMRGLQGFGAAVVLPAALSIVMNMFPEGAERNKALGLWGGIGAAGATVGLIAGGLLTRYAGWEYIFFLNVPIGAAALLLAPRIVPESRLAGVRRRFDPLGPASRGGLAGRLAHLGRARRARADARHPDLGGAGDGGRDGDDRRRRAVGDAGAGAGALLERPRGAVLRRRGGHGLRLRPHFDRRPGRRRQAGGRARLGAAQHLPAARRGDRHRDRIDGRRHTFQDPARRRPGA
jgi:hypothetical protein